MCANTVAGLFGGFQDCARTFVSKVTSGGGGGVSDMFRAVSGYFLFVHKQHPTVITSSFKYQRAPSGVQPEHWSLVLLERTNFYSMPAWRFFFSPGFFKWSRRIKKTPKHTVLIFCHDHKLLSSERGPSAGQCPLLPACLVTLGLCYTLNDIITHLPWFYFTTGSQSLTL